MYSPAKIRRTRPTIEETKVEAEMDARNERKQPTNCFSCQNRQRTEWCVLGESELQKLSSAKTARRYDVGEFIYHEGDPCDGVYCIETGLVALRKYDVNGNPTLVSLANPGRTLGYRSALSGGTHVTSAEAIKTSQVCFIERSRVRDMLDHNPALGYQFMRRMAKDLGRATERYHQELTLSVRDRFIHLLLILKGRYGRVNERGELVLELPLSRQDIAALVGTRPETLARTIRKLQDEGLAQFTDRLVTAPSAETLFDALGLDD